MRCRLMLALFAALLLAPPRLAADSFRLYLHDGTYQQVREYKVEDERVRYYSTERSEWEEIPLNLVDLKKTEAERARVQERVKRDAAADAAEEQFERQQAHEVSLIPKGAGAYYLREGKAETVKQAESTIVTNKKRTVLQVPFAVAGDRQGDHRTEWAALGLRDRRGSPDAVVPAL